MPFVGLSTMDQKVRLISDHLAGCFSIVELAQKYGISRPTVYKWIGRYDREGAEGLKERSRAPRNCSHRISEEVVAAIVALRERKGWGAKKLLKILSSRYAEDQLPARSTCCEILKRHGLVQKRRRRRQVEHPGNQAEAATAPNQIWSADFKGQFKTRDGRYCYPLTVADNYSRYLLGCEALRSTRINEAKPVFLRLFRKFGLPECILTDNGPPFAAYSLGRLSQLSAWWIQLGIRPRLIEPGKPQQNGRHERFHRTLKDRTARPPAGSRGAQQRRFNQFQVEYNEERPHEALGLETPASCYRPSRREMPKRLPPLTYPEHWESRKVAHNRSMKWHGQRVHVSSPCAGLHIGLEEVHNSIWHVYLGPVRLGTFFEDQLQIVDPLNSLELTQV